MSFSDLLAADVAAILDNGWGPSESMTYRRYASAGTYTDTAVTGHFMNRRVVESKEEDGEGLIESAEVFLSTGSDGVAAPDVATDAIVKGAEIWTVQEILCEGNGAVKLRVGLYGQDRIGGSKQRLTRGELV